MFLSWWLGRPRFANLLVMLGDQMMGHDLLIGFFSLAHQFLALVGTCAPYDVSGLKWTPWRSKNQTTSDQKQLACEHWAQQSHNSVDS